MLENLHIIESTERDEILAQLSNLDVNGAHFTNGTFALSADLIVPTTLAGFKYSSQYQPGLPPKVEPLEEKQAEMLAPPKNNPLGTVASRRNPCYGFVVVSYLEQNFPEVNDFLMETRDKIIKIVDPERTPENCPRKLPDLIKTKSLHASLYGTAPYLHKSDYASFFESKETGLGNGAFLLSLEEKLAKYLSEQAPRLIPVGLEFKEEDGTILARCRVETMDNDERPLVSLKKLLDSGRMGTAPVWDPNPLRDTTVAIVLCVAAVGGEPDKVNRIKAVLDTTNEAFVALGEQPIDNCSIVREFDKRTLTRGKHAEIFSVVYKNSEKPNPNTPGGYMP